MKIGITGQTGFLGKNLYNLLEKISDEYLLIPFNRDYFVNDDELDFFVSQCDVIVHLAAVCRTEYPKDVYTINMNLVNKLIASLERTNSTPHIINSSSIQESDETPYGRSKKEGRQLLLEWCKNKNCAFTGLVFPNVFGPNCRIFYASFIATFCHQIVNNINPKVDVDRKMNLLFVEDAIKVVLEVINNSTNSGYLYVEATDNYNVTEVLGLLIDFNTEFMINKKIPIFNNKFEENLFATFISYV